MDVTILPQSLTQYTINLAERPSIRLADVIKNDLPAARKLFTAAHAEFKAVPAPLINGFGMLYREFDGPFQAEMQLWADALGVSFGEVVVVNCGYELDHLEHRWSLAELVEKILDPFGCTTGLLELPGWGMVHLRTLDWDVPSMGEATRLFLYRKGNHEFVSIGFPGFAGVLSGMVPGEYSATINWAPPSDMPDFYFGPSFLLRKTLEECRTYEDAVHKLSKTRLSTSVFYTVCGKEPGQACVIERTAEAFVQRPLDHGIEAQSNHYVSQKFQANNKGLDAYAKDKDQLIPTSEPRRNAMLDTLRSLSGTVTDLSQLFGAMSVFPIENPETVQRMIFCPAKSEFHLDCSLSLTETARVWRRSSWTAGAVGRGAGEA